jgi:hypothetical protein
MSLNRSLLVYNAGVNNRRVIHHKGQALITLYFEPRQSPLEPMNSQDAAA